MERTIVTGANGYLGGFAALRSLDLGPVLGLVRAGRSPAPQGVETREWDSSTQSLVRVFDEFEPTRVLHVAARYAREHRPDDVTPLVRSNVELTTQVFEAASLTTHPGVVVVTSAFQHYEQPHRALNLYAATKLAALELARYYGDAHDVPWAALTIYDVYGPADTRGKLVDRAVDAAFGGPPIAVPSGEQRVGLVHVDDVVAALLATAAALAADPSTRGAEFFAAPESFLTVSEVLAEVSEALGRPVPVATERYPTPSRSIVAPLAGPRPPRWTPQIGLREGIAAIAAGRA